MYAKFTIVCFLIVLCPANYADEVTKSEIRRVDAIIAEYMSYQPEFKKFAVAVKCSTTQVNHKNPDTSGNSITWFVISSDSERAIKRYDMISTSTDTLTLEANTANYTMFCLKNKTFSRLNRAKAQEFDLESKEANELSVSIPMVRIDPWDMPLSDLSVLAAKHLVVLTDPRYIDTLSAQDVTETQEDSSMFGCEFRIYKNMKGLTDMNWMAYKHVVFDKRIGGLPVSTKLFVRDKSQRELVMSSVKTVWGKSVDHSKLPPVPVRIVISGCIGDPAKPSKTIDHQLDFNWVFEGNVSDEVFDTEEPLYAPDLQEAIIDNAEKMRILQ